MKSLNEISIGIIGLGYVGLPLAVEFGKKYRTIGFDTCSKRIEQLKANIDLTLEVNEGELDQAVKLRFTLDEMMLEHCDVYIVTVPTPIDSAHIPDLRSLESASKMLGRVIEKGNIVIYESTVYPGCTCLLYTSDAADE